MFISYLLELTVIFLHVNQCFFFIKKEHDYQFQTDRNAFKF